MISFIITKRALIVLETYSKRSVKLLKNNSILRPLILSKLRLGSKSLKVILIVLKMMILRRRILVLRIKEEIDKMLNFMVKIRVVFREKKRLILSRKLINKLTVIRSKVR